MLNVILQIVFWCKVVSCMDISLDQNSGDYLIRSYSSGVVKVNNTEYTKPLVVSLNSLSQENLPSSVDEMSVDTLKMLEIEKYEAVLLGTGPLLEQLSWELLEAAQMMKAPLEVMSTGAACRTFTVLASEGRRVLAILYP